MKEVLDRTKSQMVLFVRGIDVDRTLPKWSTIEGIAEKAILNANGIDENSAIKGTNDARNPEEYKIASAIAQKLGSYNLEKASIEDIDKMTVPELNIYLDKRRVDKMSKIYSEPGEWIGREVEASSEDSKGNIFRRLKSIFGDLKEEREELRKFDILEFFSKVKLVSKGAQDKYIKRVVPIINALRDAEEIGQRGLADALLGEMYREKYESELYANGMLYKISEKQVVDFMLKTQKGVALDYIKNFARPIPKAVRDKKLKADQLMVFDNYVVMHYDPDGQRFAKTDEERKRERERKADPILFGVINGINNLYYVADWIDEYCDLTLEQFLKVSELEKKDIKLGKDAHVIYDGRDVTLN